MFSSFIGINTSFLVTIRYLTSDGLPENHGLTQALSRICLPCKAINYNYFYSSQFLYGKWYRFLVSTEVESDWTVWWKTTLTYERRTQNVCRKHRNHFSTQSETFWISDTAQKCFIPKVLHLLVPGIGSFWEYFSPWLPVFKQAFKKLPV